MARTNIELDDRLVREGMKRFACNSKHELVDLALRELLRDAKRKEILELRGRVRWEGDLGESRQSRTPRKPGSARGKVRVGEEFDVTPADLRGYE